MIATGPSEPFDPTNYAIPLLRKGGSLELGIGTGFLGRRNGVVSLYTAAHVVYGKHPVQTPGWEGWPVELGAFVEHDGEPTQFTVFTVIQKTSAAVIAGVFPNFNYRPGAPYMLDAVRFRPGGMETLLESCEKKFSIVDLDSPFPALQPGDPLTCAGYPMPPDFHQPGGRWPYARADRRDGRHVRLQEGHLQATINSVGGHSGGPAFNGAGRFVGMVVGSNPEPGFAYEVARMIPAADVASL